MGGILNKILQRAIKTKAYNSIVYYAYHIISFINIKYDQKFRKKLPESEAITYSIPYGNHEIRYKQRNIGFDGAWVVGIIELR